MKSLFYSLTLLATFISFVAVGAVKELQIHDQFSEWVEFEIPKNTLNFQINLENPSEADLILSDLISPTGEVVMANNIGAPSSMRVPPKIYSTLKNKSRPTYTVKRLFSVNYRNIETIKPPTPGRWKARFGRASKVVSSEDLKVMFSVDVFKEDAQRRTLPVDIFLSMDSKLLNIIEVKSISRDIEQFYQYYGIDIRLQAHEWQDSQTGENDLEKRLPTLSRLARKNLSLYLFPRAPGGLKKEFQGLAGCLPAFKIKSQDMSCALLVTYEEESIVKRERFTKIMAHEIAHSLGLYHLVDDFYPFGIIHDPQEDTSLDDDPANVMHKTSEYYGHLELSPQQVNSIKLLPYLYRTNE